MSENKGREILLLYFNIPVWFTYKCTRTVEFRQLEYVAWIQKRMQSVFNSFSC